MTAPLTVLFYAGANRPGVFSRRGAETRRKRIHSNLEGLLAQALRLGVSARVIIVILRF
jgi:hypothetical protein